MTAKDPSKALGKELAKAQDPFSDGDVIRWKSRSEARDTDYLYAALRADGRWWLTGVSNYYRGSVFSYKDLCAILSRPDTHSVATSAGWDSVTPDRTPRHGRMPRQALEYRSRVGYL